MRTTAKTVIRAKRLRQELSMPEVRLWMRLRHRFAGEPAFRRQHAIGPYVIDFYCAKARLAIEVDGWHHLMGDQPKRDARKDGYLWSLGIRVHRIEAKAVLADPDWVAIGLKQMAMGMIEASRPHPRRGGGGCDPGLDPGEQTEGADWARRTALPPPPSVADAPDGPPPPLTRVRT